jgi:hypothetical protein
MSAKKMTRVAGLVLTGMLVGWVQLAYSQHVIVSEGFEGEPTAATSLEDLQDADPVTPGFNAQDDDPVEGTPGSGVQIIDWEVATGNRALLLRSGTEARLQLGNARSGDTITFDFNLYASKGAGDRNFYVIVRGMGADQNGQDFLAYVSERAAGSQSIMWYDGIGAGGNAWRDTGADHIENAWQHHRFVFDSASRTFTLYIDDMDTPVLENAEMTRAGASVPSYIMFRHEGNSADDGFCIFDDIQMTVDGAVGLDTTFTEGFEDYPAASGASTEDLNPLGPWITIETDGLDNGVDINPTKVQVVDNTANPVHGGTKSLKLEGGQQAGVSYAWGTPPKRDVEVTWWAWVPESVDGETATYLRMSLYCLEDGRGSEGDCALLGYGSRDGTIGDGTSLTIFNSGWKDTEVDYTPNTWEQYRLTTHMNNGTYSIVKNPGASEIVIADQLPIIGGSVVYSNPFIVGFSSSNGTGHPPVYVDDIEIKSLVTNLEPPPSPYSAVIHNSRFGNYSILNIGGTVGDSVVDPSDGTTIIFTKDDGGGLGGIYRAVKTASATWEWDPTPIVGGLDNPSGLEIDLQGNLWWVHDNTPALMRLKAPWAENTPELVISNFGWDMGEEPPFDDDPIGIAITPPGFTGAFGSPGGLAIADRGADDDANNAVYFVDPLTIGTGLTFYEEFLVYPSAADLGGQNLNDIESMPGLNEVITAADDGWLFAIDADGYPRLIRPLQLYVDTPYIPNVEGIAVDPQTGRVWISDDNLDQLWSIDPDPNFQSDDILEAAFFMEGEDRYDYNINFHDPGLSFAPDGSFLVVSDIDTRNGGGRFFILHDEEAPPTQPFMVVSIEKVEAGIKLTWEDANAGSYVVKRGTDLGDPASFVDISGPVTGLEYVDDDPMIGAAFYIVEAYQ